MQQQEDAKRVLEAKLAATGHELQRVQIQSAHDRRERERQEQTNAIEQRRRTDIAEAEQKLQEEATQDLLQHLDRLQHELEEKDRALDERRRRDQEVLAEQQRRKAANIRTCVSCYDELARGRV